MRKLTDIISGLDQYSGLGPYSDEYKGGKEVEIDTDFPVPPDKASVSEALDNQIRNIPGLENIPEGNKAAIKTGTCEVSNLGIKVLSFEDFIAEKRGVPMPSNVRSCLGGIDDADDDEFFEEE